MTRAHKGWGYSAGPIAAMGSRFQRKQRQHEQLEALLDPPRPPKIRFAGFGQPNGIHPPSRSTAHRHFMFARRPEVGFAHKEKLSYEQRCYESTRVREKYSDRFPVIVERDSNSAVPVVDKCAVATTRAREMSRTRTLSSVCTSRKRALTTRYPHALTPPTGAST